MACETTSGAAAGPAARWCTTNETPSLDGTDSNVMRPAMRFRGEIETGRVPSLLLAPRDAVPCAHPRRAGGLFR